MTKVLLILHLHKIVAFQKYHISSDIRQEFFSFQNTPNIPEPFYNMDLDLWDCLGWVKLVL